MPEHGTAEKWRLACRCGLCLEAHNIDTRDLRRRWSYIDQTVWHEVLRAIRSGRPIGDAAERYGVTVHALYAQGRVYPDRSDQLDAALMHGRDPNLDHGTEVTYRWGKCRCPECRAAKYATR